MDKPKNKVSFVIDIDGVIIKSKKAIPRSKQAIELIQKHNIPFIFFTNNISKNQQYKAAELTNYLQLSKSITKDQVILNYTPLRRMFKDWSDKLLFIVGRQEIEDILPFEGAPNYITIYEYVHIFPQSTPLAKRGIQDSEEIKQKVRKRLNLKSLQILDLKFQVILVLNTPVNWEDSIQIIIDLMSTNEGKVSKGPQYEHHANHIPIYTVLNDLYFRRQDHPLPRLLMKPFVLSLKAVYKQIYGKQLQVVHYGKPFHHAFKYAHNHVDELFGASQNYVMFGDNIQTDIEGAHNYGWKSVLVETGVSMHKSEKANHCCLNLEQAVKWAIRQHQIE